MGKKIKKAFTLVELMVVIAILAILSTVSIIGYKSYIRKETINSTVTEAMQAREILISKIVSNKDGKIPLDYEGGTTVLTYEDGRLNITTVPSGEEFVNSFDRCMRRTFPEIASLPGKFAVKGNDIFYHSNTKYGGEYTYTSNTGSLFPIDNVLYNQGKKVELASLPFTSTFNTNHVLREAGESEAEQIEDLNNLTEDIGFDVIVNIVTLDYTTTDGASGSGEEGGNIGSSISITIDQFEIYLTKGGESKKVTFSVSGAESYKWISGDTAIASVTQDGVVSPVGVGRTTVRIQATDANGNTVGKSILVVVTPVGRTPVPAPAQSGRLIYKPGVKQTPTWINFKDSNNDGVSDDGFVKLTITPQEVPNTSVGDPPYIATFELVNPNECCWADNFSTEPKRIYWRINKIPVKVPYQTVRLEFDYFETLNPTFGNFNPTNTSSGFYGLAAYEEGASDGIIKIVETPGSNTNVPGLFSTFFEIIDPKTYIWEDGDVNARREVKWRIYEKTIKQPRLKAGVAKKYEYTGGFTGPGAGLSSGDAGKNFDYDTQMSKIISGDGSTVGVNVGSDYGAKFELVITRDWLDSLSYFVRDLFSGKDASDYFKWEDGTKIDSDGRAIVSWEIVPRELDAPSCKESIVWDGTDRKDKVLTGFDSTYMEMTVTKKGSSTPLNKAADVGNYTTTVRIKDSMGGNVVWKKTNIQTLVFNWSITRASITKPTEQTNTLTYDGTEKTATFNYSSYSDCWTVTGEKAIAAGEHTATFTLKNNYQWADGTTDPAKVTWTIGKGKVSSDPSLAVKEYTYTGSTITPSFVYNKNMVTIKEGTGTGNSYGDYTTVFQLKDPNSCTWADGTTADKTITWKIKKAVTNEPTYSKTTYDFTGNEISPFSGYDSTKVEATNVKATKAGNYTATFKLKGGNCTWPDGSESDITVNWKINSIKIAKPSLSETKIPATGSQITPFKTYMDGKTSLLTTSNISGTNKGNYSATFEIKDKDSCTWSDGTANKITIEWEITKAQLEYPNVSKLLYSYNSRGNTLEYSPSYKNNSNVTITTQKVGSGNSFSGATATDRGDYVTTFKINNQNVYEWSTGNSSDITISWSIKNIVSIPEPAQSSYVYDRSTKRPFNNVDTTYITEITSNGRKSSASKAGNYNAEYKLDNTSTSVWSDGSTTNKVIPWSISVRKIEIPVAARTIKYDGSSQYAADDVFDNYDTTYYTPSRTSYSEVGTHIEKFTLDDPTSTQWSDGTTSAKSVSWEMVKGDQNISVSDISVDTNGGSPYVSGKAKGSTLNCSVDSNDYISVSINGDYVKVTCSKQDDREHSFKVNVSASGTSNYNAGSTKFTVTVKKKDSGGGGGGGCITDDTEVLLADRTVKLAKDITEDDVLLAFNHETGKLDEAKVNFIEDDGWKVYNIVNLEWSNGKTSKVIYEHGFFDLDLMKYVYIHEDDYMNYIGDRFYDVNGNAVTLDNAYVTTKYSGCYSFPSDYHLNFFMDDMLSMPGGITGMFNIFEYDDDLKYNEEKMKADIETYGLFDYSNVAEFVTEDTFNKYPTKYVNVSIGKGLMSEEDFYHLVERYAIPYQDNEE